MARRDQPQSEPVAQCDADAFEDGAPEGGAERSPAPSGGVFGGRKTFIVNVLSNWVGQAVALATGFVLPRFIDDAVGKEMLGVWDFGWAMFGYIQLAGVSISAGVTHFVSTHMSRGDEQRLRETLAVTTGLLLCSCALAALFALGLSLAAPYVIRSDSPTVEHTAGAVILLLGLACVLSFGGRVQNAVIAGCGRFDLLNLVDGSLDLLNAAAMIALVLCGFGVQALAVSICVREGLALLIRNQVARRLCPASVVWPSLRNWAMVCEVAAYNAKTVLGALRMVLLYQTNSLVIATLLGPAALATFSRPRSLVMHVQRLVDNFARVLMPRASALHAESDVGALRRLTERGEELALFMILPAVAFLTILGGPLLHAWMGSDYDNGALLAVLAVGHIGYMSQRPMQFILMGMAMHGLVNVIGMVAAGASVALAALLVGPLKLGLLGAALGLVVPLTIAYSIICPLIGVRRLGTGWRRYLRATLARPLLGVLPLVAVLLVVRGLVGTQSPARVLAVGAGAGGLVTAITYWMLVLPRSFKARVWSTLRRPSASIGESA